MAITQIDPYYRVGTATFAASTAVTGHGTSWLGNVEPGDQIFNRLGQMAVVASVNSDTSITLVRAFAGTVQTAQAYEIYRVPDSVRLENFSQRSVNLLKKGNVQSLSDLLLVANKLIYAAGDGTLAITDFTAFARTLLDDANASAMLDTLQFSAFAKTLVDDANAAAVLATLGVPGLSYETGTYTPVLSGSTTAGAGTYSRQAGRYVKIGPLVLVILELIWSAHTGTGAMQASLPFVASAVVPIASVTMLANAIALPTGTNLGGQVTNNTNLLGFVSQSPGPNAAISSLPVATSGLLRISGIYFT